MNPVVADKARRCVAHLERAEVGPARVVAHDGGWALLVAWDDGPSLPEAVTMLKAEAPGSWTPPPNSQPVDVPGPGAVSRADYSWLPDRGFVPVAVLLRRTRSPLAWAQAALRRRIDETGLVVDAAVEEVAATLLADVCMTAHPARPDVGDMSAWALEAAQLVTDW